MSLSALINQTYALGNAHIYNLQPMLLSRKTMANSQVSIKKAKQNVVEKNNKKNAHGTVSAFNRLLNWINATFWAGQLI